MKILYVVNSTRTVGGASKSFLTLLFGAQDKGIEPYVITPDKGDMYQALSNKGIPVTALNYRMNVYPDCHTIKDFFLFVPRLAGRRILEYKAVRNIIHLCKENQIDIIHTNVSLVACGRKAAKKLGIPHVWHVREYGDLDFRYHHFPSKSAFYNELCTNDSYTICITKGIQNHHHLKGQNSRVIYNGIEITPSIGRSEFQKEIFFLYAGRMEPSKNPFQVVTAYHHFINTTPNNQAKLILAGPISDRTYWKKIKKYIYDFHLEKRVEYVGIRKDIDMLMRDALATIVSSEFEAFGRCLPEAMINDCLTIGRNKGGTKEQYDNGVEFSGEEIGLRYETTEELANIMTEVYKAPKEQFIIMKAKAKEVVKNLYNKENYIKNVLSYYTDITNNYRK